MIGVVLEERFQRDVKGHLYSPSGFGDEFWQRYIRSFGKIGVVARVESVDSPSRSAVPISDRSIEFLDIPHYVGLSQFIVRSPSVLFALRRAVARLDAVILRLPGTLGLAAGRLLKNGSRAYAVELVGDPQQVFASGIGGFASPLLERVFYLETKGLCRSANAVSYVTSSILQRKYPAGINAIKSNYSSVQLSDDIIIKYSRDAALFRTDKFRIFCAGSLEVPYKGVDVLIEAVALLKSRGTFIDLRVAGDGRYMSTLKGLARSCEVLEQVNFLGHISREQVLREMDECHLYVQPSRTEGLPRSIIEAFARASPVVATSVGGIPELIDPRYLAEPSSMADLASVISSVLCDPNNMAVMSRRNLTVAAEYRLEILEERRTAFYNQFSRLVSEEL